MSIGGRGTKHRKTRVNETKTIDILDLHRKGVFSKKISWAWTSSWLRNDKIIASIRSQVEFNDNNPTGLRFSYSMTDKQSGERKDYNYIIPVVSTPCHYGGKRWWFICPHIVNGKTCQRRCRIIYLPQGAEYFGCRECYQLTYESRQKHREKFYEGFERPLKEIETLKNKLYKTKSREKKEKICRRLSRANSALERFHNDLTNRKPTIIYQEK